MSRAAAGGSVGVVPLAGWAGRELAAIADISANASWHDPDGVARIVAPGTGATLLTERATLNGFRVPGLTSAGGGCRLLPAREGMVALTLSRDDDRDLLPALFADGSFDPRDDEAVARKLADCPAAVTVERGRELGLAIAATDEAPASPACTVLTPGRGGGDRAATPLVIDLSALWAGPLAGGLLAMAGARVVKVESRNRPDAMRHGDPALFARLNHAKASVALDLRETGGRDALLGLIRRAGVVIEAARPRALLQLGIDADAMVREVPGLVWITITAHGTSGEAANWIGFGDDCAVAGGLAAALRKVTGQPGFVGDAMADPLTGIAAARAALSQRQDGTGARLVLAMSGVVAAALGEERERAHGELVGSLRAWAAARGQPFAPVAPRPCGPVRPLGADNDPWLADAARC